LTKEEFWILIFSDYQSYILITIISLILLYVILQKIFHSIFHPFFFYYILIFGFCISGVTYLFYKEKITEFYFFYYISAQLLFIIGLYIGKYFLGKKYKYSYRTTSVKEHSDFIYYLTVLAFILFQLITYIFFGIPVFAASRWETYNSLAGAGIIGRIIEVSRFIVIFFLVYKFSLIKNKKTIFDYFTLAFLVITGFLTGSKMSILEFFFIAYISYYTLIYSGYNLRIYTFNFKRLFLYGLVIMFASLFTVYINQLFVNNTSVNPLLLLSGRFVASPDLQIMTYPNDILTSLYSEHSFLEIIFLDLKTLFNKIGFSFTHSSLGVEAFYYHYPYLKGELNSGPLHIMRHFFYIILELLLDYYFHF